jgi:hypothetical protein
MKSTYEQRWGHKRTRKAVKHLEVKAQKRAEADERTEKHYQNEADRLGLTVRQYKINRFGHI